MIATASQLAELLPQIERVDRIAVDTEADSLHCYYEKLCLVQLSFGGNDHLIDPLAGFDLAPLATALSDKEIVLQGAISICVYYAGASILLRPGSSTCDRRALARHSRIQPAAMVENSSGCLDQGSQKPTGRNARCPGTWRNMR